MRRYEAFREIMGSDSGTENVDSILRQYTQGTISWDQAGARFDELLDAQMTASTQIRFKPEMDEEDAESLYGDSGVA